jgi:hypothetical protein
MVSLYLILTLLLLLLGAVGGAIIVDKIILGVFRRKF